MQDNTKPLSHGRLLDDGIPIIKSEDEAIKFLSKIEYLNPTLTFTHEGSDSEAIFVDILLHYQMGFLTRSLYTKEMPNMTIIYYKSDHPYKMREAGNGPSQRRT